MEARAMVVILMAAIAMAALSICQVSGQKVECHVANCTSGSECASTFDSSFTELCTTCITIIQRFEGATTQVERRCADMLESFIIGCKITVVGQKTEEMCLCNGARCNGAYTDVYDTKNPLRCVQCRYQEEIGKGTEICNENPTDPALVVTCPSANRCVTEYDYYAQDNRNADRYCGRWNQDNGCYKESTGLRSADVCFCSGELCNNVPVSSGFVTSGKTAGMTASPTSSSKNADSAAPSSSIASAGATPKPTGGPSTGGAAWRFTPDFHTAALSLFLTVVLLLNGQLGLFTMSTWL